MRSVTRGKKSFSTFRRARTEPIPVTEPVVLGHPGYLLQSFIEFKNDQGALIATVSVFRPDSDNTWTANDRPFVNGWHGYLEKICLLWLFIM